MFGDAIDYLETSFLSPLFKEESLTDISYNGDCLYFVSSKRGRLKSEISVGRDEVGDFLRQIANLSEKQFSFASPILDVSFGRYRLNAVYSSLVRKNNEKTFSFSLRIASELCKIDDDPDFFEKEGEDILLSLLEKGESLVIGGQTGSGKTELEKWCLLKLGANKRVIVIDNVEELDLLRNDKVDLTVWMVNERIKDASFSSLVRNALRNDPDYIMVAEGRGEEMLDAIVSAMSGHPIITSIHAQDLNNMPERVVRLALLSNERLFHDEIMFDVVEHLQNYAYLKKVEGKDGEIHRYLDSIGKLGKDGKMTLIYKRKKA